MPVEVRGYELQNNGKLEPLFIYPLDYFGGACPNVGDTICNENFEGTPIFYGVQRRYFKFYPPPGWALILRQLEAAPPLTAFYDAWQEDTAFWDEIDEQERQKEEDRLNALAKKLAEAEKRPAPRHRTKRPPPKKSRQPPQS